MSRSLNRSEVAALAADLRAMMDRIEAGDLDATAAMRHRIEGALAVLEVVQGRAVRFEAPNE
jgi:transcription elongation GreA/GreB family factor